MTMGRNVPLIYSDALHDLSYSTAQYSTAKLPPKGPDFKVIGKEPNGTIHWRLTLRDTTGGLNVTRGDFEQVYNRISSSSLDTRTYRHLTLPFLNTTTGTPDPGSTNFMGWCDVFGVAAIGIGATNNASLFAETSATNPAIVAKTYSPGSAINGLVPIIIGGTATHQLAVLREGGAIQILSDLAATPTVAGTMHSDTTQAYGIIQTPTPEYDLLIYAGSKIRTMRGTDAITREPDDVLNSVPNYGYAIGIANLGRQPRAFWMFPRSATLAAHMLTKGSESAGRIVHTDLNGRNPQEMKLPMASPLQAAIIRDGIIVTDGTRIVWHNGEHVYDLRRHDDRGYTSNLQLRIRGMWVRDPDVYIECELQASPSGSAATTRWIEHYNFDDGAWHVVSGTLTYGSTGAYGLMSTSGTLPLGRNNSMLHQYADGSWRRLFQPPFAVNPYDYRRREGGGTGNAQEFEATGTTTFCEFELPDLEGWPKLVSRVIYDGDVDEGGSGASVQITAGNISVTFLPGLDGRAQNVSIEDNGDYWFRLLVSVTLTRDSGSTSYNLNGLPIIIEGQAFVPEVEPASAFLEAVH